MSSSLVIFILRYIVVTLITVLSIIDDNCLLIHINVFIISYDVFITLPIYLINNQANKLGYNIKHEVESAYPMLFIFWLVISIIISIIVFKIQTI